MISSVELGNFLSHSETLLEFDNGVTVFVGDNGAGKSSVIDAITFALFGKHTRKSNKGLVKRGTNQGFSKVIFKLNDKQYQVERKIDTKGSLTGQFSEKTDGKWNQIAAGERKQFGESMTGEIEKRIGLDFEKLKVASIVQQGELNSIINASPKEFKELLNAIIGIDKLDIAANLIKLVCKNFRENVQKKIGYDDTHIEILEKELEKNQEELNESRPILKELSLKKEKLENEIMLLRKKYELESPKIDLLNQLETRKDELFAYAKQVIKEIRHEITEKERLIQEFKKYFEQLGNKGELESNLKVIENSINDKNELFQNLLNQKVSFTEKLALATKLKLKNNKCPICDSVVDKLKPIFEEEYLKTEIVVIEKQIQVLKEEQEILNENRAKLLEKIQNSKESEAILRTHSIKEVSDLKKIQKEIEQKKENTKNIPLTITSGNLVEVAKIDSHARMLFNSIVKLQEETKDFDQEEFNNLKNTIDGFQNNLSIIDQKFGAVNETINSAHNQITKIKGLISDLVILRNYLVKINEIETKVFNRDGPVATSLRSWALSLISENASEYLLLLNSKIQRVILSEKSRDITITCFARGEILDLESLSGGEQVGIALALRLGMAKLLGTSNLDLMILDEPTTHLDAYRRKALVNLLSQLSNITNSQIPMQFIIITHDSEIFENSSVEHIFKFETIGNESKVTALTSS